MRALLIGALLLSAPVSAQEGAVEARQVLAPCLPAELLARIVGARRALPMPIGLDAEGAVWTAYVGPKGEWLMVQRIEGRTCIVSAGHPGTWLSVLPGDGY